LHDNALIMWLSVNDHMSYLPDVTTVELAVKQFFYLII